MNLKTEDQISILVAIIAFAVIGFLVGMSIGYGKGADNATEQWIPAMRELGDNWELAYEELSDKYISCIRGENK